MQIHVTKMVRRITYESSIEFHTGNLSIILGTWPHAFLESLARSSQENRMYRSVVERLRWALKLLALDKQWKRISAKTPAAISSEDLFDLFFTLEQRIEAMPWAPQTKSNTSSEFRKLICRYLHAEFGNVEIAKKVFFFPTRFTERNPRELISDLESKSEPPSPPSGALPHDSVEDLKNRLAALLGKDLKAIEAACISEIDLYKMQARKLIDLGQQPLTLDEQKLVKEILEQPDRENITQALRAAPGKIAFTLNMRHATSGLAFAGRPPFGLPSFCGVKQAYDYAMEFIPEPKIYKHSIYHFPFLANSVVLVSCLIALQIHTGWNASSVISLCIGDVAKKGERLVIQGYKSKSDDHTPAVVVSLSDHGAYEALNLLLARLSHLKRLNLVEPNATSLWLMPTSPNSKRKQSRIIAGVQAPRDWICRKYALPNFSFDQIRTQALALISMRKGGLEVARRLGGHCRAATTAHYLDHLILQRLNSAINLEFQKKLEASIVYASKNLEGHGQYPEGFLLYPVGDGSSCANPVNPPKSDWLVHGMCRASQCHSAEGCPNRRIVVNAERVEEIAATTFFYEKNWSRLLGGK
ncbi:integrase [Variovorax boronicumulans]|uniref:Integrase n=1 Tax=Variovorax boronicumulans TaxID=436515 RepID=A0AAW8DSN7_9BURK|nr:hypothetical protein [Variovorax boronicumulans]MDP9876550.1 integrase [Variovorax boronicumulans]MDP9922573.1 integrase [Variovorax boronicumulans]